MNTMHDSFRAAFGLGCLFVLAGCASQPVTSVPVMSFAPVAPADSSASVTSAPVPVHTVAPEYPINMRRDGIEGFVNVACRIDATGRLVRAEPVRSSDFSFVEPALAAVRQWRFKPALRDGVPVEMDVTIPIRFALDPGERALGHRRDAVNAR